MLVVPVLEVRRLAAACALVRVPATVVQVEDAGAAVVLEDPEAWRPAAERLSRVLGQVEVAAFRRGGDQVEVSVFRAGAETATPAAGAALARLPDLAERLVLGAEPSQIPGAVSNRGMSRATAARTAMAGSSAEAAWAERAQRWERVLTRVLLAVLAVVVVVQLVLTAGGGGSPIVLGVAIAMLGLLGVREIRRRADP